MSRGKLRVEAVPQQSTVPPAVGSLTFVENTVDAATGTIKCKATFPNEGRELWPGEFVNVTLTLDTIPDAILVPTQAVQTGQKGNYVYVVRQDNTAEQRPVVSTHQYSTFAVVDTGLRPGERVITDGQLKVVPNAKVQITRESDAAVASGNNPAGS
jgi:multidrug efflux system membrane fusion protein